MPIPRRVERFRYLPVPCFLKYLPAPPASSCFLRVLVSLCPLASLLASLALTDPTLKQRPNEIAGRCFIENTAVIDRANPCLIHFLIQINNL